MSSPAKNQRKLAVVVPAAEGNNVPQAAWHHMLRAVDYAQRMVRNLGPLVQRSWDLPLEHATFQVIMRANDRDRVLVLLGGAPEHCSQQDFDKLMEVGGAIAHLLRSIAPLKAMCEANYQSAVDALRATQRPLEAYRKILRRQQALARLCT